MEAIPPRPAANESCRHQFGRMPRPARRSIAVLGFRNLSGRPEEGWLSTALAEMLSTELEAGEKLRLVSGEDIARTKLDLPLADADSLSRDTLSRLHKNLDSDLIVARLLHRSRRKTWHPHPSRPAPARYGRRGDDRRRRCRWKRGRPVRHGVSGWFPVARKAWRGGGFSGGGSERSRLLAFQS